ncbi:MAG: alpha/beta hydrolase, partial [Parvularculaceae bacterium]|nr:alpha/beta hydrolase [Parvularculaceae bacterium]
MTSESTSVKTSDGLALDVKIRRGGGKTPAFCIPGLTRNAADFEDFADQIAATGRDVYAISLRGRGLSHYDKNHLNYHPLTYRGDVISAFAQLGLENAVFVGTSLGGITTMLIAQEAPALVRAAVINDVGPELAPEGIARIAGYVGARPKGDDGTAPDLAAAAEIIRGINEVAFPGKDRAFWEKFARRTFRQTEDGRWRLDYDPKIAQALAEVGAAPDLWPAFASLRDIPTLVLRGAISDLLSTEIIN